MDALNGCCQNREKARQELHKNAILSKSLKQHPTKEQLYGHLPPISKTIQRRQVWHARHCWRSKDKLISDVLLWTPWHGCASVGQPIRTYLQQFCIDTGCSLKNLLDDRQMERGGERERNPCLQCDLINLCGTFLEEGVCINFDS